MERPKSEEFANTLTHGIGAVLSAIAAIWLMSRLENANGLVWAGCLVYGLSLVAVYVTSTLSHYFTAPDRQRFFRQLDQAFIYLLIVASYTPFSLAFLHGAWWWTLLTVMWVLALLGFASKLLMGHRVQAVSIWLYLLLGWVPAMGGMPWSKDIPFECILWIVYGGIAYTAGTVFLFNDKRVPYFHALWHVFVMAGSAIHFWGVVQFIS